MKELKFSKELYSKVALIKAAYNFTDKAYIHLDTDSEYYYISMEFKGNQSVTENEFVNEMLAQSVRHEIYGQTKNIRELLLARAMATSVVVDEQNLDELEESGYSEDEILKDWFDKSE